MAVFYRIGSRKKLAAFQLHACKISKSQIKGPHKTRDGSKMWKQSKSESNAADMKSFLKLVFMLLYLGSNPFTSHSAGILPPTRKKTLHKNKIDWNILKSGEPHWLIAILREIRYTCYVNKAK